VLEHATAAPPRGYTVRDVSRRYRVSPEKVRAWIARGELLAINTASVMCGKPRWVVTAEALEQFERGRQTAAPPPKVVRHKRPKGTVDFYPD
jgi:hypothetical protein